MNLRNLARDRECQVRLDGVCNGNPATTVLAHFRMVGISGLGLKSPDLIGAWACSDCHDAIDRRRFTDLDLDYVRYEHLKGVVRTQAKLIELGAIKA